MSGINAYKQNQSLTVRVLESIDLYIGDVLDSSMNVEQREQSRIAALTLIDHVLNSLSETVSNDVKKPVENVLLKTVADLVSKDKWNLIADSKALRKIISMC